MKIAKCTTASAATICFTSCLLTRSSDADVHSSRKQLLLRNRFSKPLIDDLIKLLLLAAAMKYSSCLTGRLADVLLSLHSGFYFLQNVFVFGLLLLFAGINESQLGVKRRHRVALGSAQSPLAAWDVEHR